jgi:hypothetical protein
LFKLSTTSKIEPIWYDLPHGIRVRAIPLSAASVRASQYLAAKAHAAKKVELGIEDGVEPTDEQTADLEGAYLRAGTRAMVAKIQEWQGVVGDDDQPLPVTPEALDAFTDHPLLSQAFRNAYEAETVTLATEGNGSGSTGPGASPEGSNTAAIAPANAPDAPGS